MGENCKVLWPVILLLFPLICREKIRKGKKLNNLEVEERKKQNVP
jgi:hypothetical protein